MPRKYTRNISEGQHNPCGYNSHFQAVIRRFLEQGQPCKAKPCVPMPTPVHHFATTTVTTVATHAFKEEIRMHLPRHTLALLALALCLTACSGNYKFNDDEYRPLGEPQAVKRGN